MLFDETAELGFEFLLKLRQGVKLIDGANELITFTCMFAQKIIQRTPVLNSLRLVPKSVRFDVILLFLLSLTPMDTTRTVIAQAPELNFI